MKMCSTHCHSRWFFLLTLAVVMLVSVHQAGSSPVGLPCCRQVSTKEIKRITSCYEQKPRYGCSQHAFLVNKRCVDPNSKWLKDKIEKGEVKCPPVFQL